MAHTLFGQFLDTPLASHTLPLCQTRILILHYSYYNLHHCHSLLLHNYFHGYSHCCLYHKSTYHSPKTVCHSFLVAPPCTHCRCCSHCFPL
ncbi:hypothetical protein HanPI659440_Chr17g0690861 [Helianthus annuus]|nr:hypothetical protein HanPI659440_Chr17g0690861 [Helianthus annuus]